MVYICDQRCYQYRRIPSGLSRLSLRSAPSHSKRLGYLAGKRLAILCSSQVKQTTCEPIAQADLAVSPFKTHPKLQTRKGESTSKKVQSIPMKKARGKENRKQRSLVPIACDLSDSEDDPPVTISPLKTKRSAVQRLPFSSSPGKRNVVVATQGNVRKSKYDPMKQQQQRSLDAERHDRLRSEYATHRMASCIDV